MTWLHGLLPCNGLVNRIVQLVHYFKLQVALAVISLSDYGELVYGSF